MLGDGVSGDGEYHAHQVVLRLLQLSDERRSAVQVVWRGFHEVVEFLHLVIHGLIAVVEDGQRTTVRELRKIM